YTSIPGAAPRDHALLEARDDPVGNQRVGVELRHGDYAASPTRPARRARITLSASIPTARLSPSASARRRQSLHSRSVSGIAFALRVSVYPGFAVGGPQGA